MERALHAHTFVIPAKAGIQAVNEQKPPFGGF
jgi:hypothetical protein